MRPRDGIPGFGQRFVSTIKQAGNMHHDFCMHTCTRKRAHAHTHTSKSTEPSARSKGGLGSGQGPERPQPSLPHRCVCLGLSHAPAPYEAHSRHSWGGGEASSPPILGTYYWLTFSRIREVQTEGPRTTEGGRTFPSGGYIVRSSCPTSRKVPRGHVSRPWTPHPEGQGL